MSNITKEDRPLVVGLEAVDTAELVDAQMCPGWPAIEPPQQARLMPLYEQPDSIVRAVIGDLSDFELDQYREQCKFLADQDGKTYKCHQQNSTGPEEKKRQTQEFRQKEIAK